MDIKFILDKAKDLLKRDKHLTPVLFVETEKNIFIIGIIIGKEDKIQAMRYFGRQFATNHGQKKIKSLYFVSDSYITKIGRTILHNSKNKIENKQRDEAIIIDKWDLDTNKKETIIQHYKRLNNDVIYQDDYEQLIEPRSYLLEAFIQGYYGNRTGSASWYDIMSVTYRTYHYASDYMTINITAITREESEEALRKTVKNPTMFRYEGFSD